MKALVDVRELVRRRALPTVLLLTLFGCSDTLGPSDYAGTYDLQTFAGKQLPASDGNLTMFSGVLTLTADGEFQLTVESEICTEGQCGVENNFTEEGTFTVQGVYLTLRMDGGDVLEGRVGSGVVILQDATPGSYWALRD